MWKKTIKTWVFQSRVRRVDLQRLCKKEGISLKDNKEIICISWQSQNPNEIDFYQIKSRFLRWCSTRPHNGLMWLIDFELGGIFCFVRASPPFEELPTRALMSRPQYVLLGSTLNYFCEYVNIINSAVLATDKSLQ